MAPDEPQTVLSLLFPRSPKVIIQSARPKEIRCQNSPCLSNEPLALLLLKSESEPAYGLTRRSISVPLSSFTLFFSEVTTEPSVVLGAADNCRFDIPITPWVFSVMGWLAAGLLAEGAWPPAGEGVDGCCGGDPALIPGLPAPRPVLLD
jgi:hypothetical protein